jgi:hypothetical protein
MNKEYVREKGLSNRYGLKGINRARQVPGIKGIPSKGPQSEEDIRNARVDPIRNRPSRRKGCVEVQMSDIKNVFKSSHGKRAALGPAGERRGGAA